MAVKTQGTELWVINASNALVKVGCVTAISGISSPREQIETTCLEDDARSFLAGLQSPGQATFTINFDPSDTTHRALETMYGNSNVSHWAIGLSDGTSDPTVGTDDNFDLPTSRSWITFDGFIADLPFDFAQNSVVASNISVQMSGERALFYKT